jgi:hypothetical protein
MWCLRFPHRECAQVPPIIDFKLDEKGVLAAKKELMGPRSETWPILREWQKQGRTIQKSTRNRKQNQWVVQGGHGIQIKSNYKPFINTENTMKRSITLLGVLILLLTLVVGSESFSQTKKGSKKKPSEEEMMKRWQETMTPGPQHKMLEASVGTWDAEVKMWMKGPTGEPTVSKGVSENKMVLGGRYLQQDFTSEMMGQPFVGTGFTGYDNFNKKYIGFWIDNMSTAMSLQEGVLEKDGKTMTMWGKMDDPSTGEKGKKVKYVARFVDSDTQVFETYDVSTYGDKKPTMEITYKRRK